MTSWFSWRFLVSSIWTKKVAVNYSIVYCMFSFPTLNLMFFMHLPIWLCLSIWKWHCWLVSASENDIVISTTMLENVCGLPFISYVIFHISVLLHMWVCLYWGNSNVVEAMAGGGWIFFFFWNLGGWIFSCSEIVAFGSDSLMAGCGPVFMSYS